MSRSFGGTSLTSLPPMKTLPPVTSSRPAIMRRIVVLPQPEGPTSTTNSRRSTLRLQSITAWIPPAYVFVTFARLTCAIEEFGELGELRLQLLAVHDPVDHAVLKQELGGLETLRQLLTDRLLDHARPRESDERPGLGEDEIAQTGEARPGAGPRRVRENGNKELARLLVAS